MKKLLIFTALVCVALVAMAAIPNTTVIGDTSLIPFRAKTNYVKLYAVIGNNMGPAQFVMISVSNNPTGAAPTNGQKGTFSFPVAATNYFVLDLSYYGVDADSVTVWNSTTADTNTTGLTNCSFQLLVAPQ